MTRTEGIDMDRLVTGVLDILSGPMPMPHHFERLADKCGLPDGPVTILFLTGLRRVLAQLPEHAFVDAQTRLATLDAVQGALDVEIEWEERRAAADGQEQAT
jgi:type III secretion system TyeA family effector delivery regulator